jgi:mono/diheme cytochrome c family protein
MMRISRPAPFLALVLSAGMMAAAACTRPTSTNREAAFRESEDRPERYLPDDLDQRPDSAELANLAKTFDTDEDAQPDTLPALPYGMDIAMIQRGDALFHGKGGCLNCHGSEAQGLPARGKTLTAGLHFVQPGDWDAIDSLVMVGLKDGQTRSPISMPPRGQGSDLSADEVRDVSAYVWAISQVKGEPWPGGHRMHVPHDWRASARSAIP